MTAYHAPHPTSPNGGRSGRRLARLGLALVAGPALLASTLLTAGAALTAGSAGATAFCDPSVEDCGPPPAALFAQLNTDITTLYPATPTKPVAMRMATQAENAYPPQANAPSDFCPSYAQFGALAHFVAGQSQNPGFPRTATTVILGDTATIRSAPIWTIPALPPSPCIGS
jgi:hypothetical protein